MTAAFILFYWLLDVLFDLCVPRTSRRKFFDFADLHQEWLWITLNCFMGIGPLLRALQDICSFSDMRPYPTPGTFVVHPYLIGNIVGKTVYDLYRCPMPGYMIVHHIGVMGALIAWGVSDTTTVDEILLLGAGSEIGFVAPTRYAILLLGRYGYVRDSFRLFTATLFVGTIVVFELPVTAIVFLYMSNRMACNFTATNLCTFLLSAWMVSDRYHVLNIYIEKYKKTKAKLSQSEGVFDCLHVKEETNTLDSKKEDSKEEPTLGERTQVKKTSESPIQTNLRNYEN